MKTSETIIAHPSSENFDALVAFMKALKIKFEIPKGTKEKKAELIDEFKDAFNQVKLHQEGKIKLQSARDFLNEL
jgi:hypothetical protein